MNIKFKIPPHWKCEFQTATVLAMGSGIGAACGCGLLNWWYAAAIAPFLILLNRRQLLYALTGFMLCLTSGVIRKNFVRSESATLQPGRISGQIICLDRRVSGAVTEYNPVAVDCLIKSDGKIFSVKAVYPDDLIPFYGNTAGFTGRIITPQPMGLICENNEITGELPPQYGNTPLLIIDHATPGKPEFSLFRLMLKCRDLLIKRLISNITDPEIAAMASQICFGTRPQIRHKYRKNFIESGTIHLFSVSGLHVMLAAGMILWLLKLLPFRIKYITAAVFTLLYVLCTGAELPAVRAGSMVIIWCIMRSILVYTTSWQTLMWTWSVFVLIFPASTGSLSAQYSFGITAALILAVHRCREFFAPCYETLRMMPFKTPLARKYSSYLKIKTKLFSTGFVVATAFLAGCGLTLFRQNQFTPGSIPANLLLILLTPILFGTFGFKLLAGWITPAVDRFAALLIETVFHALLDITGSVAEIFPARASATVPLWSVIGFYLCFFGMYGLKTSSARKFCAFGTLIIFICWQFPEYRNTLNITVISNSSSSPALIAIAHPDNGTAVIVDTPDAQSAVAAGRLLKEQGIKYADVIFSSGTLRASRGVPKLANALELSLYPGNWKRKPTAAFHRFLRTQELPIAGIPQNRIDLSPEKQNDLTIIHDSGVEIKSEVTGTGRKITVCTADGRKFQQTLPWCSLPVIWQCTVE